MCPSAVPLIWLVWSVLCVCARSVLTDGFTHRGHQQQSMRGHSFNMVLNPLRPTQSDDLGAEADEAPRKQSSQAEPGAVRQLMGMFGNANNARNDCDV